MLVREAMQTAVVTLLEDDDVAHAARVLLHHGTSSAPVLSADGALVGILSESDVVRGRVGRDPRASFLPHDAHPTAPPSRVADLMTPHPVTVDGQTDLADATALLLERGVKALSVLEHQRLVGVLARRDVLRTLAHEDGEVREAVLRRLEEDLPGTGWAVDVREGVVTLAGPGGLSERRVAAVLARTVAGVVEVADLDGSLGLDESLHRSRP